MCTIFGITGKKCYNNSSIIASTSDNHFKNGPHKPIVLSLSKNGHKVLHTPCLEKQADGSIVDLGSDRGINEQGLAWTRSWVVPNDIEDVNALDAKDFFMTLADSCASVDDAIKFMQTQPKKKGCQGNFIFADKNAKLACIEVAYKKIEIVYYFNTINDIAKYFCTRTNHFENMQKIDVSEKENKIYFETSNTRLQRSNTLLQKDLLTIEDLKSILADTENIQIPPNTEHGMSICSLGKNHGTVSAEIIIPNLGQFYYYYGLPNNRLKNIAKDYKLPINSWNKWFIFDINKMCKFGFYTDLDGIFTELGEDYFGL